jgi:hypothetical protein
MPTRSSDCRFPIAEIFSYLALNFEGYIQKKQPELIAFTAGFRCPDHHNFGRV